MYEKEGARERGREREEGERLSWEEEARGLGVAGRRRKLHLSFPFPLLFPPLCLPRATFSHSLAYWAKHAFSTSTSFITIVTQRSRQAHAHANAHTLYLSLILHTHTDTHFLNLLTHTLEEVPDDPAPFPLLPLPPLRTQVSSSRCYTDTMRMKGGMMGTQQCNGGCMLGRGRGEESSGVMFCYSSLSQDYSTSSSLRGNN